MDIQEKIKDFFIKLKKSNFKIAIFGDSILDEYYNVISNRISPEFPIPVSLTSNDKPTQILPGGAGNVCRQFLNFDNIRILFYSLLDGFAYEQYFKNNINVKDCIIIPSPYQIPRKRRFYNNSFPLFRWDVEQKNFGINNIEFYQDKLLKRLKNSGVDACIFSDYSKGVFSNNINYSYDLSIVDPKDGPLDKWKNCDVFKPNRTEAFCLSNKSEPLEQCKFFKDTLNCKNVLITDSYKGFYGIDYENNFFEYKSEKENSKVSVIGGGDCFISYLTLGILLGFNVQEAAEISFNISYFYVTKNNNINLSYLDFYNILKTKVIDENLLINRDFKLIFTNGCFDAGLTSGHIECLKFAKSKGDKLVVALNSDKSVKRLKGKNRPIMPLKERIEIISAIDCVDFVLSFEEDTPLELIKKIKPDIIVKGGDYKAEDVVGYNYSKVVICPKIDCISTTEKVRLL